MCYIIETFEKPNKTLTRRSDKCTRAEVPDKRIRTQNCQNSKESDNCDNDGPRTVHWARGARASITTLEHRTSLRKRLKTGQQTPRSWATVEGNDRDRYKKANLIKIFDFQITIINNNYDFLLGAIIIYFVPCSLDGFFFFCGSVKWPCWYFQANESFCMRIRLS